LADYINGYSFPRFRILDASNNITEEIDLELTNSDGLIENYIDNDIQHILELDKEIVKVRRGGKRRIEFTLHYNQRFQKALGLKIQRILNYEQNGFKIFLIPRSDVLGRSFEVVYSGDEFQIGINRGGAYAQSNKMLVMKWVTKRIELPNWIDPDDIYIPLPFAVI